LDNTTMALHSFIRNRQGHTSGSPTLDSAHGFTLIELLVVVCIIGVLVSILLPSLGRVREAARMAHCAANLNAIGKSMSMYATQEMYFPTNLAPKATSQYGSWKNPPRAGGVSDGVDIWNQMYVQVPKYGDPMTNLWILVLLKSVTPQQFICKSDPAEPQPAELTYAPVDKISPGGTYTDFGTINDVPGAGETFSYAFPYPWSGVNSGVPGWWKGDPDSSRPIGADMGPTKSSLTDDPTATGLPAGNSKNHKGKGQNVAFADDHVEFARRNDVGRGGDNIFTADGVNIYLLPGGAKLNQVANLNTNSDDVILVPGRASN